MPGPERDEDGGDAFDRAVDRHFAVFYRDSTLWPVLVVAIGAALSLGSAILIMAVRDRSPYALAALAILGWMSVDLVYRDVSKRRFGPASRAVVGLWLGVGAAAGAAAWLGIF